MSDIDKHFDAHWEAQTKGGNQWSTLERLAAKEAFAAGFNTALKREHLTPPSVNEKSWGGEMSKVEIFNISITKHMHEPESLEAKDGD